MIGPLYPAGGADCTVEQYKTLNQFGPEELCDKVMSSTNKLNEFYVLGQTVSDTLSEGKGDL